MNISFEMWF